MMRKPRSYEIERLRKRLIDMKDFLERIDIERFVRHIRERIETRDKLGLIGSIMVYDAESVSL